jgi:hypothetical protein
MVRGHERSPGVADPESPGGNELGVAFQHGASDKTPCIHREVDGAGPMTKTPKAGRGFALSRPFLLEEGGHKDE